jgi:FKBP-type peptidyl-prolyl cis-trans isomerase
MKKSFSIRPALSLPTLAIGGLFLLAGCDSEPTASDGAVSQKTEQGTLENGMAYEEVRPGNGPKATLEDYVTLHYKVIKSDGTLLADSAQAGNPPTFLLKDTLPGWQEALTRMNQGDVWRITVPADLAYGDEGLGDMIAPGEDLGFELSLLKVETKQEWDARRLEAFKTAQAHRKENMDYLEENAARSGVTTTDSGLQYEVLQEGGGPKPSATDTVRVHYRGTLVDGTEFDSSYSRGQPAEFPVNGVIKGWQEALQLMNTGSKYRLVIPADLAYGNRSVGGLIKAGSTLVFEVELLDILG